MMNYNLGLAGWKRIFARLGFLLRLWKEFDDLYGRLTKTGYTIEEFNDPQNQLYKWSLNGVEFDKNTDAAGRIYVRLDAINGTIEVFLYKNSARTELVAEGSRNGNGVVMLAERNNSGLSGTVEVAYIIPNNTIYLVVKADYKRVLQWYAPMNEAEEGFSSLAHDLLETMAGRVWTERMAIERALDGFLTDYFASVIGATETGTNLQEIDVDEAGNTIVDYEGLAGELKDAMEDDPERPVLNKEEFDTSAIEYDADNIGQGVLSLSLENYCRVAELRVECIGEAIGDERFSVSARLVDGSIETSETDVTIKRKWRSPQLGVEELQIIRTITDSGTRADKFSNWIVNGESEINTDGGVLYCKWIQAEKKLELYNNPDRTPIQKVAEGMIDGFPKTLNFSGATLSGSVDIEDPGGDSDDLEVSLNPFKIDDRIRVTVVLPFDQSYFHRVFARLQRTPLPSSDAPNIPKQYATRG